MEKEQGTPTRPYTYRNDGHGKKSGWGIYRIDGPRTEYDYPIVEQWYPCASSGEPRQPVLDEVDRLNDAIETEQRAAIAVMPLPEFTLEERFTLSGDERCTKCGHLYAFHSYHCCPSCGVSGCPCEDWER